MQIDPVYLEIAFDKAGVRNSQKRLATLIEELAVEPLKAHHDRLSGQFDLVEEIITKRVAAVIAYWCQHKHDPIAPTPQHMMSEITNSRRNDMTLEAFYANAVTSAMYTLAPAFDIEIPNPYTVAPDELEYSLLELEEVFEREGIIVGESDSDEHESNGNTARVYDYPEVIFDSQDETHNISHEGALTAVAELIAEEDFIKPHRTAARQKSTALARQNPRTLTEVDEKEINLNILSLTTEEAWQTIYQLMGYRSEYIQDKMLPRWQQSPTSFEQDRRFLYDLFFQVIRNAAGVQVVAGNFTFADRQMSIDQLWNAYFTDLSQHIGPQLAAARFETVVNERWYTQLLHTLTRDLKNLSLIWLLALIIALVFDALTTYVSLDQTPMDGPMVIMFTVLITALFQIADLLVINYRQREFDADAMGAKYSAKFEQYTKMLQSLDISSDSYVQFSLERSRAQADWKAAEDSRKMARRGRFWSARIADINIAVTAYGFAYLFLDSEEPMYALFQQLDYIFVEKTWDHFNLWVFLMVGMAVTVSFVINTAQRTEILGWSMRRLKKSA